MEILVRVAAEFTGIVENLPHHLAPRLRIAPKLAFDNHQPPVLVSQNHIDEPHARNRQFLRHREHSAIAWVELMDRHDFRVIEYEVAQGVLAARVTGRHPLDHLPF